ncbi:hypothetical protein OPV22_017558 [Ensete ventricosum]|uniref:Uncharacterized protein n=1 Tax=Ensete ventricosum TaxID=4639 RepID=A0AAV8R2G0_ENSVE|nr:hypothetical protein OPV22_017558 [Ensete ventricosum]
MPSLCFAGILHRRAASPNSVPPLLHLVWTRLVNLFVCWDEHPPVRPNSPIISSSWTLMGPNWQRGGASNHGRGFAGRLCGLGCFLIGWTSWASRFLFAGRLLGYIFSRNPTGMVSGGGILAPSFFSLKVWRTGRSSLPFILGQAVPKDSTTKCPSMHDWGISSIGIFEF